MTLNFSSSGLQTSDQSSVQDIPTLSPETSTVSANSPVIPPQADLAPTQTATDQPKLEPADRGGAYNNPGFTAANTD